MPQSSGSSSPEPSTSDFGANSWLVEEMRERFDSDPKSLDSEWRAFFSDGAGTGGSNGSGSNGSTSSNGAAKDRKSVV